MSRKARDAARQHMQAALDTGFRGPGREKLKEALAALDQKRAVAPAPSAGPTVGELIDRYIEEYARKVKRSWAEDQRLLDRHVRPAHGHLPVSAFTAAAADLIYAVHQTAPREAEKLRAVISTMFNVGAGRTRKVVIHPSWIDASTSNPVAGVVLPKREAQNHTPGDAELRCYLRGLADLGDIGDVLRTQIETCARIGEVVGLTVEELDLDAERWVLPASRSKNGRAHVVMLAPSTVERLRGLTEGRSGRVWPGLTRNRVMDAIARNRSTLGVADGFTSHSTRHAMLTWLAESGASREVRDRISNHTPPKTADAIYNAAELNEPAREWLARWCDHLAALEGHNVIELKKGTAHA